ncbi:hypothetical protein PI125_g10245 [Phytophthora idaei]|nr:hypothetical protein PI125_g10245 [Phytophthora idaei]
MDDVVSKNYDEFAEFASPGTKVSKCVKATKNGGKLKALITKHKTALAEWAALTKKLKGQYPDANKLSLSTLRQLDKIEGLGKVDIKNNVKGAKETADGMRRKITPFAGMELPDPKYLVSHVGHDMQRFDKKDGSRLLSSAMVMRTNEQGQHQIVLFSSSNPKKGGFLLPEGEGDWDKDIKKTALREVIEEGGVNAQLAHGLGKVKFEDGGKKYTYFAYLMKANKIYHDWAESIRDRLWVSLDEAEVMLARRGQKVEVVKRAKTVNPFVDTHLGDCAKRFDEVMSAPANYESHSFSDLSLTAHAAKRALTEAQPVKRKQRRPRQGAGAHSNHATHLASTLDFNGVWKELKAAGWTYKLPRGLDNRYRYISPGCTGNGRAGEDYMLGEEAVLRHFVQHRNPGSVQVGNRHQHAVDRASHTAEATADDAGLTACRRNDARAEAGAARTHAQSLVAGEHSNAGGATIAHSGRGGEGDDRIVGGADFGPCKTTTSRQQQHKTGGGVGAFPGMYVGERQYDNGRGTCVAAVAARGGSVEVDSDGGGADSIDAGASRDRDQDAAAVQHPINELDARGAGVGHQRTADRDAHVAATCGVDMEVIGGEDDVDDPVDEAVRGRGQVTSARRQEHGNAGFARIVRGEDGGENSDGAGRWSHRSQYRDSGGSDQCHKKHHSPQSHPIHTND